MLLYWGSVALPHASLVVLVLLAVLFTIRTVTIDDERVLRLFAWKNPLFCLVVTLILGSFSYYTIWLVVPVNQRSTTARARPTASKVWAPR